MYGEGRFSARFSVTFRGYAPKRTGVRPYWGCYSYVEEPVIVTARDGDCSRWCLLVMDTARDGDSS